MSSHGDGVPRLLLPASPAPQALAGGSVLILAGLAIAGAGWWFLPQDPGFPGVVELVQKILLTGFGAAFVLLGLWIAAGRTGAAVDRGRNQLVLMRRILFWKRRWAVGLDTIRRIEVVSLADSQRRSPAWLEVHTTGGKKAVTVGFGQTATSLRRLAQWIRDWSGLPAEAFAGLEPGEKVPLLAPEEIEVRLALERLASSRWVRVHRQAGRLTVEFLPLGWRGLALLMLAAAFGSGMLLALLWRTSPGIPQPPFLLFGIFPLVFLAAAASAARGRIQLEVAGGLLHIVKAGPFRTKRLTIPAGEVSRIEVNFLGEGSGSGRWTVVLVSRSHTPLLTLAHLPLNRRRGTWEDIAVLLRAALSEAAG